MMGGEQAATVLSMVGTFGTDKERDQFKSRIREQYESQGSPYYSTARLWDDGVIDSLDTPAVPLWESAPQLISPMEEPRYGVQDVERTSIGLGHHQGSAISVVSTREGTAGTWREALDAIEYDPIAVEITKVGITGVVGQELGAKGWKTIHSAPEVNGELVTNNQITDEVIRDAVKASLLDIAEMLTVEAGYAAAFKDRVYSALLHHVRAKFLNGSSLGLASRAEIQFAAKMLRQVKTRVEGVPGLTAGIIEDANQ